MNGFIHTLAKMGVSAALVGSYVLTSAALAAPSTATISGTPSELQAKADDYAKRAAEYRARVHTDDKHAMAYFTLANRLDQKAQRYHLAALEAGAEPAFRR